jgi:hypothetical protein
MKNSLKPGPIAVVVGTVVFSVALLVYLYTTVDQDARQHVRTEAMTVLMQLVAIGIIGGLVTWVLNERSKEKEQKRAAAQHEEEKRKDALNEFRRSAVTRVDAATKVVRMAPIVIKSHRSWETYDEQAKALLDVRLDLRALHHDLRRVKDAFTKSHEIEYEIQRSMEGYLDRIIEEWTNQRTEREKKALEEEPGAAWEEIRKLPELADLLKADTPTSRFYREYLAGQYRVLWLMGEDIFIPDPWSKTFHDGLPKAAR